MSSSQSLQTSAHRRHQVVHVLLLGHQRGIAADPGINPPVEQREEQPALQLRVVARSAMSPVVMQEGEPKKGNCVRALFL